MKTQDDNEVQVEVITVYRRTDQDTMEARLVVSMDFDRMDLLDMLADTDIRKVRSEKLGADFCGALFKAVADWQKRYANF